MCVNKSNTVYQKQDSDFFLQFKTYMFKHTGDDFAWFTVYLSNFYLYQSMGSILSGLRILSP